MDPLMVNRIFDEIDQQGDKMESLSKITYENSATLGILSKLVILIITFLIIAGLTASYNMISTKVLQDHQKEELFIKEKTRSVSPYKKESDNDN